MKLFILAIRSCPRFLNWLLILSLLGLLVKILWLDSIPAFFPKATELGSLMDNILIANVAGYLFFILSSEVPKVIEKRNNAQDISYWAESAANRITGFLQMAYYFNKALHPTSPDILAINSVDLPLVKHVFALVNPTALSPMNEGLLNGKMSSALNWLEAMAKHDLQCLEFIAKLWRISPFIESELSSLMLRIENSSHTAGMKSAREIEIPLMQTGATLQNQNLSSWAENYYESYEIARQIFFYCKQYRESYVS